MSTETPAEPRQPNAVSEKRNPKPFSAALAGFLGLGLGYLYIGRARVAFMTFLAVYGSFALVAWTRLITEPAGVYLASFLAIAIWLVSIVHPAIVAYKTDQLPLRAFNRGWIYIGWFIGAALIGNLLSEYRAVVFGFEPFRIPSTAMAPTLQRDDLIMVDTWRFRRTTPNINDLIVFDLPEDRSIKYLFRVVGLPGNTIEIDDDVLLRNAATVSESYIQVSEENAGRSGDFGPIVVPENHYFVLGDNRHNARDSRFIGAIHERLLHGRVEYRWYSSDEGFSWSGLPAKLTPDTQ